MSDETNPKELGCFAEHAQVRSADDETPFGVTRVAP